ncbi:DnaK suppressor domain-containing protein [Pseudomonas syringae pv. persicae]|uniref:DnaK suppressor domain-containing protein n=1 Tax=Pseudomonas syringae pv. persicae TaxID=237306 RepID=A0AB38EN78_9PSED|nr:DnaK suppressor domain protein [Pseudomonas syringae pv. persicae]SOQ14747.1 DnaK suppressor domain-containing protein [Pseudomonas syringae pv. persicae]SOQ14771.1 DnaK suppressor domain-containing protein [Pseudomonas syringae pv. persicae]
MIESGRQALSNVLKALEILALGDYGFCQETGEAIGLKRLLPVPESLYSVESMRVLEAKGGAPTPSGLVKSPQRSDPGELR